MRVLNYIFYLVLSYPFIYLDMHITSIKCVNFYSQKVSINFIHIILHKKTVVQTICDIKQQD